MPRTYPQSPGLLRGAQMVENGTMCRAVSSCAASASTLLALPPPAFFGAVHARAANVWITFSPRVCSCGTASYASFGVQPVSTTYEQHGERDET